MGLTRQDHRVRAADYDRTPGFLNEKIVGGKNIVVSERERDDDHGTQIVISSPEQNAGAVVTIASNQHVPCNAVLALIDAGGCPVEVTLPDPTLVPAFITLVCLDNSYPISILTEGATTIFDTTNIGFNTKGDSLIFASNRIDTWYCISRYTAILEY